MVHNKDTNAAAVILFDIGKTRFIENERIFSVDVVATYTLKKGGYLVEDYPQLKSHLETVVDQFNTPLIFQEK